MKCEKQSAAYAEDLAYIHDAGFGHIARAAAGWLVVHLKSQGYAAGRIVELGCGSGVMTELLVAAGYDVTGFDISADMLAIARKRAPMAEFRHESFVSAKLPPCIAVTGVGEVFNYLFDKQNTRPRLARLFRNVHRALANGGVFVFDVAGPGRVPAKRQRGFTEGDGWACLFEAEEDERRGELIRRITSFRRVGETYRRSYEEHRLRLLDARELSAQLRAVGFTVKTMKSYGEWRFPPGWKGIAAHKL